MVAIQKYVRVNDRIRVAKVRVIGPQGEQLGIVPIQKALDMAEQYELDMVEVSPNSVPPVCRIMDYAKFKYEEEKKERQSKKRQHQAHLKEIRLKPNIEEHDYQVKLNRLIDFLKKKDKVKIGMFFRGREMAHQELGRKIMDRMVSESIQHGTVEKSPALEGRAISMIIGPK